MKPLAMTEAYQLIYWPGLQGRGELVRLALEATETPYVDVARLPEADGGGIPAVRRALEGAGPGLRPFAPPVLVVGELGIAQTANILAFLGPRLGLVPDDEGRRAEALQLQLTVTDWVAEVHDTHHPIGTDLYYEEQREEAKKRSSAFLAERLPKFMGYFEDVIEAQGGDHLLGADLAYPDLSVFQVLRGLAYAFPKGFGGMRGAYPRLQALEDRVAAVPALAAYLASERRIPFNEHGIFRRYPELDI